MIYHVTVRDGTYARTITVEADSASIAEARAKYEFAKLLVAHAELVELPPRVVMWEVFITDPNKSGQQTPTIRSFMNLPTAIDGFNDECNTPGVRRVTLYEREFGTINRTKLRESTFYQE